MTPFGHLSASYLASRPLRKLSTPAIVIGGLLPDVDFALLALPQFNQLHRVITHSLLFVCLAAGIGFLVSPKGRKSAVAAGLLIGGALHLLVDSCLDTNPSNGIGVALWWPFHDAFFSPFNLYSLTAIPTADWGDPIRRIQSAWLEMLLEMPLYAGAAIAWIRHRRGKPPGESKGLG